MLLWDSETNVVETSVITAGKLEVEDDEVVLILLVEGAEDRVEDVLEAALEVLEELVLESEEEEEALVEDEDEEGKDVVGVVDEVVGVVIGSGRIGVTTIGDEDDADVVDGVPGKADILLNQRA